MDIGLISDFYPPIWNDSAGKVQLAFSNITAVSAMVLRHKATPSNF